MVRTAAPHHHDTAAARNDDHLAHHPNPDHSAPTTDHHDNSAPQRAATATPHDAVHRADEPDPLALALHSDILGVAVERHGPFTILSLEIAIRFLATPTTPWVLQEIEAWHVGDGYATGPARLWDEAGRLCAIVNQTAQVRPAQTA